MTDNAPTASNLTGIEWRFTEWLTANGGLRPDNIMEYFSLSPFWDPTSNNAVLKMQTQFNELQTAQLDLKKMTGIEFAVVHEKWPTLFIIRKQRRRSPSEVVPLATFYIINGNIYQSPDLHSVVSSRLLISLHHLTQAFQETSKYVEFHPSEGYSWMDSQAAATTKAKPQDEEDSESESDVPPAAAYASREYMEFQKSVHQAMATATTKLAEVQRQTMLRHQVTQRIEQMPSVSTPAKPATPKTPSVGTPKADSLLKRKKKSASDATSGQTGSAQKRRKKTPSMVSPKIA